MDYQYNERGWLTQINHQNLDALDNGVPQDPGGDGHNGITQGDKFAEVIGYNQQGHIGGGPGFNWLAQYNGNISWSITHTSGIELPGVNAGVPDPIIGYVYNYDGANRLTNADFGYYHTTSGWSNSLPNAAMYDLPNISYYGNGNINNLQRNGVDAALMDNFTYNYQLNTNKLNSIADAVTMQSYTYGYDYNGNLISDTFRGITNIVYNNRNLPEQLTSSSTSVNYWYDGTGNRIRKLYEDDDEIYVLGAGGETEAVFDAEGNAKFFNITSGSENLGRYEPMLDELKLMNIVLNKKYTGNKIIVGPNVTVTGTAELKAGTSITLKPGFTAVAGCSLYAHIDPTATNLTRFYYLKDHLGSTRVTVNQNGSDIVSYDDYDPWGMQLDGRSGNLASAFDKFKFTGKERDVETGYDYFGARYYDSRIARWLQVDPLAEKYPGWSTYNYSLNNPIKNVDPDGRSIKDSIAAKEQQENKKKLEQDRKELKEAWDNGDVLGVVGNFFECLWDKIKLDSPTLSLIPEVGVIEGAGVKIAAEGVVENTGKLLNQFNSAESLIKGAGKLSPVKAGMQGFIKGDGESIFKTLTQNATKQANGTYILKDGSTLYSHYSTKTGIYTIDINKAGKIFKIRVRQ